MILWLKNRIGFSLGSASVFLCLLGFSPVAQAGNSADLAVVKTASSPTIPAGSDLVYTMVVSSNNSTTNVVFDDPLPPNTTFVSLSIVGAGTFACTTPPVGTNGTVNCTAPAYPLNNNTLTLTVNVDAATPNGTVLTNTATFFGEGTDSNLLNNTSTVTVDVTNDVCGDAVVSGTEECDDGNTTAGDCCDSACLFEVLDSLCDDGDANTSDDSCDGAGTCLGIVPAPVQGNDLEGACSLGLGSVGNPSGFLGMSFIIVAMVWRRVRR